MFQQRKKPCWRKPAELQSHFQSVLFLIVIKANGVVIFMNVDNIFVSIYLFFYRVLIYGSHAILINLCKNENGKIPFSSASVILLSEVMKFVFSVAFLIPEMLHGAVLFLPLKTLVFFSIPALLYCISNNTAVHVQVYLDPASFQVQFKYNPQILH